MSQLQRELHRIVGNFVDNVTQLARRRATESLREALAVTSGSRARSSDHPDRPAHVERRQKRTSDDLAQVSKQFVAYVREHPGLRIEQINKGLGSTTDALALPIRKLIADGAVKTKGVKRSTTYFAMK